MHWDDKWILLLLIVFELIEDDVLSISMQYSYVYNELYIRYIVGN